MVWLFDIMAAEKNFMRSFLLVLKKRECQHLKNEKSVSDESTYKNRAAVNSVQCKNFQLGEKYVMVRALDIQNFIQWFWGANR